MATKEVGRFFPAKVKSLEVFIRLEAQNPISKVRRR
jgi:hypothetical protein